MKGLLQVRFLGAAIVCALWAGIVSAAELNPEKPFAEHHIVLQISDNDPVKFSLVLDITNNLIRHYGGPEYVDLEVIAFGGGVYLLTGQDNAYRSRLSSLMDADVKFYVCLNTLDTIERKSGVKPLLVEGVIGVQTGVAFMVDEINRGYTHIRP